MMITISHDTQAAIDAAIRALASDPQRVSPEGCQVMAHLAAARDIIAHGAEADEAGRLYADLAHVVALIIG